MSGRLLFALLGADPERRAAPFRRGAPEITRS